MRGLRPSDEQRRLRDDHEDQRDRAMNAVVARVRQRGQHGGGQQSDRRNRVEQAGLGTAAGHDQKTDERQQHSRRCDAVSPPASRMPRAPRNAVRSEPQSREFCSGNPHESCLTDCRRTTPATLSHEHRMNPGSCSASRLDDSMQKRGHGHRSAISRVTGGRHAIASGSRWRVRRCLSGPGRAGDRVPRPHLGRAHRQEHRRTTAAAAAATGPGDRPRIRDARLRQVRAGHTGGAAGLLERGSGRPRARVRTDRPGSPPRPHRDGATRRRRRKRIR